MFWRALMLTLYSNKQNKLTLKKFQVTWKSIYWTSEKGINTISFCLYVYLYDSIWWCQKEVWSSRVNIFSQFLSISKCFSRCAFRGRNCIIMTQRKKTTPGRWWLQVPETTSPYGRCRQHSRATAESWLGKPTSVLCLTLLTSQFSISQHIKETGVRVDCKFVVPYDWWYIKTYKTYKHRNKCIKV